MKWYSSSFDFTKEWLAHINHLKLHNLKTNDNVESNNIFSLAQQHPYQIVPNVLNIIYTTGMKHFSSTVVKNL